MKNFAICLIVSVLLILTGCTPAVRTQAERDNAFRLQDISAEDLLTISKAIEQRFERHNLLFNDDDLQKYLEEVLDRLITPQEKKRYNLNVRILRSPVINAFGYPHGTIFITVALLTKLNSEAQLAAALSHEIIHIVNRHAEKNLENIKERSRREMRLHPDIASLLGEEAAFISSDGAGVALNIVMRGYSRELEREADSLGVLRMAEGGYPHAEFLSLLLLLRDHVIAENIAEQSFCNSHPRITERIRNYHRTVKDNSDHGKFSYTPSCPYDSISKDNKDEKNDDKNSEIFRERIKKAIYENVRVNISAGRYDLAEDQIEKFLAADGCDTEALTLKGDFERSLAPRSTQFFIWYKRALECDSSNIAALRAIGFGYYSMGNCQKAHKYLSIYNEIAQTAADIGTARLMLRKCEERITER